jgi:hypothetical protein
VPIQVLQGSNGRQATGHGQRVRRAAEAAWRRACCQRSHRDRHVAKASTDQGSGATGDCRLPARQQQRSCPAQRPAADPLGCPAHLPRIPGVPVGRVLPLAQVGSGKAAPRRALLRLGPAGRGQPRCTRPAAKVGKARHLQAASVGAGGRALQKPLDVCVRRRKGGSGRLQPTPAAAEKGGWARLRDADRPGTRHFPKTKPTRYQQMLPPPEAGLREPGLRTGRVRKGAGSAEWYPASSWPN